MKALTTILDSLKIRLKPSRYEHTLRVMSYGESLGKHHGVSIEKIKYAAALHDYCKNVSDEEILASLLPHQINTVITNHPNLGHGYMAAIIVKDKYDIIDEEILNAISDHTFGSEFISNLGKVLYLADHLEPGRNYVGVDKLRQLAMENLDEAVILCASNTMMYELSHGNMLHEATLQMRNHLLKT